MTSLSTNVPKVHVEYTDLKGTLSQFISTKVLLSSIELEEFRNRIKSEIASKNGVFRRFDGLGKAKDDLFNDITEFWILFAKFERSQKLDTSNVVRVFEDALEETSPVSKSGQIYVSYASYHFDRNELSDAQAICIRGVTKSGVY